MRDHYKPWPMTQAQARVQKRVMMLYVIVIFGAFAIAGQWDYEAQRVDACARAGKLYDAQADVCVKPPPKTANNLKEE